MVSSLAEQLVRDEGVVLHAYPDSLGFLTIGIGRLIDKRKNGGISLDEALYLLQNDIKAKTTALLAALPWASALDEARRGALLNLAFNLGVEGLLGFKNFLSLMEKGQYAEASRELLNSKWATQVGPRANRLSRQIATGEWV